MRLRIYDTYLLDRIEKELSCIIKMEFIMSAEKPHFIIEGYDYRDDYRQVRVDSDDILEVTITKRVTNNANQS